MSPTGLYAADLQLAQQCATGDEGAWGRFVLEYRPVLYRAADALEPGGGARDLADALYADLYGMHERDGERRSLFRYFQGRSSLATWLRAVLAQRYVDRLRARRHLVALPEEESRLAPLSKAGTGARDYGVLLDIDRDHYVACMQRALAHAVARLSSRDRLRLGCYYLQSLTLADTGRLLREHEATVSRQLARARRAIRVDVERELRQDCGLSDAQIAECFESTSADAGTLDLEPLLGSGRKKSVDDRSR